MKQFLGIQLIISFFCLALYAQSPAADSLVETSMDLKTLEMKQPEVGYVTVRSTPSNCWVRIDSALVGKTPLEKYELAPGTHFIQVLPKQTGTWNYQQETYTVRIVADKDTVIKANFETPVLVNSLPFGATLSQDTTKLGLTPLYVPFESFKDKQFTLSKAGYKPFIFTLMNRQAILAELEKDENYVEQEAKPQLLGLIPRRHMKSKFSLLALTIATQWTAFYFKNLADQNYEDYQQTADPLKQADFWDATERYDRISDITLGVSYTSLVGLIYMVMKY